MGVLYMVRTYIAVEEVVIVIAKAIGPHKVTARHSGRARWSILLVMLKRKGGSRMSAVTVRVTGTAPVINVRGTEGAGSS